MKNSTIAIITLAVLTIGGYFVYKSKFWVSKPNFTKDQAIALIVNSGNSENAHNLLSTFDDLYVIEWANGIYNNQKSFSYKGKNYNVKGGKLTK